MRLTMAALSETGGESGALLAGGEVVTDVNHPALSPLLPTPPSLT